jgi:hypothetical protein
MIRLGLPIANALLLFWELRCILADRLVAP